MRESVASPRRQQSPRQLPGGKAEIGPQAERSSQWVNRGGELNPPSQRDDLSVDAVTDKMLYEQELSRLRAQNKFLEEQVQRVSKELKIYQLRDPRAASRVVQSDIDAQDDLPPWVTDAGVMSPLVAAYDARIQDLEATVKGQRSDLSVITQRTEQLVQENETLRETQIRDIDALVQQTDANGGLVGMGAKEMVDELNERINILMAEMALMADQTGVMAKELEKSHQELEEKDSQIVMLSRSLEEAGRVISTLEEQVPRLTHEKHSAEQELAKHVKALAESETHLAEARSEAASYKDEIKTLHGQNASMQRSVGELQRRLDRETEALSERVQHGAARVSELQGQLGARSAEAEAAAAEVRRLTRDLDAVRGDAEGMLQVIGGMESQLKEYQSVEEETARMAAESKTKVEDALLARDQARALEVQGRRELERVLAARKSDAELHLSEQDEAVAMVKAKLTAQIDARERDIKELMLDVARHRNEAEAARRDQVSAETLYTKLKRSLDEEQEGLKVHFAELGKRVEEAESKREAAEKNRLEALAGIEQAKKAAAAKEAKHRAREGHLEGVLRAREHEVEGVRSSLRAAVDRAEKSEREVYRVRTEMEENRGALLQKAEEAVKKAELRAERAEGKLNAAERKAVEREATSQRLVSDMRTANSKTLAEMEQKMSRLSRQAHEESELAHRMSARCKDLQNRLQHITADRNDLANAAGAGREEVEMMRVSFIESQRKVKELSAQLNETLAQQEVKAREMARSKAEVKRAQLDLARVERDRDQYQALVQQSQRLKR